MVAYQVIVDTTDLYHRSIDFNYSTHQYQHQQHDFYICKRFLNIHELIVVSAKSSSLHVILNTQTGIFLKI